MQNRGYNHRHLNLHERSQMPKQNIEALSDFGKRLVSLRKEAGYTQVELAKELDVSQRMISYYEGHPEFPPSSLLPKIAQLLNVTTDELLGLKAMKLGKKPDSRLKRRFQQIEKLPTKKRRQLVQVIDTYLEASQVHTST
jgi:transcriptional regulator with XRE-family HTH domain